MLRFSGVILLVTLLLAMLSLTAAAVDLKADYFNSVKSYFNLNSAKVGQISKIGIADEELPVVFFIADRSKSDPDDIAKARLGGESWTDICDLYSMNAADFYMIVADPANSKTYGPIFEKFENMPQRKWNEIELSDIEIVNLVNLKLMYSLHDYSVYEIMAMRDFGKSFLRINQQVELAKQEINDQQDKTLEAR